MKTVYAAIALALAASSAAAQNVKITPIGSHPGELCANDRAIVFEGSDWSSLSLRPGAQRDGRRRSASGHHTR